ncbi:MAG TPA: potassium/proton antiporter, partial [Candidatus Tectomicrobia bacterium]|nr:potassium/proton antiporter [Candidatus Tectomicrobia bacterium]
MIPIEYILLAAALLLGLSVLASKASSRLGVPALLLFLLLGMLAGSDGPGGIEFDDAWLAQSLGVVALVFILFAGGLDTRWEQVRSVIWPAFVLSTLGVALTALLTGWFATVVLGFSWLEGLLLGAIVSSTDAAAVFGVLSSKRISLKGRLKPLLELESGSNDPMAIFLTLGLTRLLVEPEPRVVALVPMFFLQMTLGAALGYGMGRLMTTLVNSLRLEYEGLYPVLTMAFVLLSYGAGTIAGGNGFLAAYLAGLVMGNYPFIHKRSLMHFHNGLAWLMQITMFFTLGLLVFPSRLVPVAGVSLLIAVFLMFIARPVVVFVTLLPTALAWREQLMVSWVGLRGAVPIILATFPMLAGVPQAEMMFNVVFFTVLTSVLLQGTSLPVVAKWLGVDAPLPEKPRYPLDFVPTGHENSDLVEISVPPNGAAAGKQIVELGLPPGALIVLVNRADEFLVPSGGTVLEAGDKLLVLTDKGELS